MGRKRPSSATYTPRKKAKTRAWKGPYAVHRKANLKSYMKNLWRQYPAKQNPQTDRYLARHPTGATRVVAGLGDYRFSRKVRPSLGARAGAFVGDRLQRFIGNVTGLGDYHIKKNSLWSGNYSQTPQVMNGAKRQVSITRKEFLGDVITADTPGAFSINDFIINPGNPETFPWLAGIASAFQEYRIDGMLFHFKTMSADALNSTNTALGSVVMATEYNPDAPLFTSKQDMENTEFSSSIKPSESCLHPIECARHESVLNELYVARGGIIPPGGTRAFYDFARFSIATQGFQAANVNIGELWVTYQITLFKPIQVNGGTLNAADLWAHAQIPQGMTTGPMYLTDAAGAPSATFFPLGEMSGSFNVSGHLLTITRVSSTRFQVDGEGIIGKSFLIQLFWQHTGTTVTYLGNFRMTIASGAVGKALIAGGTTSTNSPTQNITVNTSVAQARIEVGQYVTATANSMVFDMSAGAGTAPNSQIVIPALSATNRPSLDLIITEIPTTMT